MFDNPPGPVEKISWTDSDGAWLLILVGVVLTGVISIVAGVLFLAVGGLYGLHIEMADPNRDSSV